MNIGNILNNDKVDDRFYISLLLSSKPIEIDGYINGFISKDNIEGYLIETLELNNINLSSEEVLEQVDLLLSLEVIKRYEYEDEEGYLVSYREQGKSYLTVNYGVLEQIIGQNMKDLFKVYLAFAFKSLKVRGELIFTLSSICKELGWTLKNNREYLEERLSLLKDLSIIKYRYLEQGGAGWRKPIYVLSFIDNESVSSWLNKCKLLNVEENA